jgi:hypothetical protein
MPASHLHLPSPSLSLAPHAAISTIYDAAPIDTSDYVVLDDVGADVYC